MVKKQKEEVPSSMMTNLMCRGMDWRNVTFRKIYHAAIKEPVLVLEDDLELEVEEAANANAYVAKKMTSKPKVTAESEANPLLFEWLTRLYIVLEELQTRLGVSVGEKAKVYFPVPNDQVDLALKKSPDCRYFFFDFLIIYSFVNQKFVYSNILQNPITEIEKRFERI
jgi:hypothetical protein